MNNYYTIRQASGLLGIKVRTVREWIRNGKLTGEKHPISHHWCIPQTEIERLRGGKSADDN